MRSLNLAVDLCRLRARITARDGDRMVVLVLLAAMLLSALSLTVNPWPRDYWFQTQDWLFGRFPGQDNYSPIAAPAVFYKLTDLMARALGLDLAGEFYLASFAQNVLMWLTAVLVYYSCKRLQLAAAAGPIAILFLGFMLSTGLAQAFWSENVVLFLFAVVLWINAGLHRGGPHLEQGFWLWAGLSSLVIALLVVTRITPLLMIPALFVLLSGRLPRGRLFGYAGLAVLMTGMLLGVTLAGNYARFGRVELTNSSGRHLWQAVNPLTDTTLAHSAEYQELKALNPRLQGVDYWRIRFPDDERRAFGGEALLGRLAKEAIRRAPGDYLLLGVRDFIGTIGSSPYRLGFDGPSDQYNPLHTLEPLPSVASVAEVPGARKVTRLFGYVYRLGRMLYPVAVFLVLTTLCALLLYRERLLPPPKKAGLPSGRPVRFATVIHFLVGIGMAAMANVGAYAATKSHVPLVLCMVLLFLQLLIVRRNAREGTIPQPLTAGIDGLVYTSCALMFFVSLWFSWQVEYNNPRNVLPYLPFLAVMLAMSAVFWTRNLRSITARPARTSMRPVR